MVEVAGDLRPGAVGGQGREVVGGERTQQELVGAQRQIGYEHPGRVRARPAAGQPSFFSYPHRAEPELELDTAGYGLVAVLPDGSVRSKPTFDASETSNDPITTGGERGGQLIRSWLSCGTSLATVSKSAS
jgi:hypothetical protein